MSKFNKLSRAEIRNVLGGKAATCTWTWSGGAGCASGTTVQSCSGSATTCQTGADNNCNNNDCCKNVDCR